jgi:hypothetical protein
VAYAGRALAHDDCHDVEAYGLEGRLSIEEVPLGQGADLGLFTWGDGLHWVSEAGPSAQLHLDEYEGVGFKAESTGAPELCFRALLAKGTQHMDFERVQA